MRRLISILTSALICCVILFGLVGANPPKALAAVSDQEIQNTKSKLISDLKAKVVKLNYISQNIDPGVAKVAQALDTLVNKLDGMDFKRGTLGGKAYYKETLGPNTIYVTDAFFDSNSYGAYNQQMTQISQMAVLLHEAVHVDQQFLFKARQMFNIGKDQAEAEADMIEYILLRALGGGRDWAEAKNALEGLRINSYLIQKTDDAFQIDSMEKYLDVYDALALLDGGVDQAYDRLNKYASSLPAGAGTKIQLRLKVVDSQGKPVPNVNVNVKSVSNPLDQVFYTDPDGTMRTHHFSWLDLARTFKADERYVGYMQQDGKNVTLFSFAGKDLFAPGRIKKEIGEYCYIDLGEFTAAGKTVKPKENKDQKPFLRLNLIGPNGGSVPADKVSIGFTSYRDLKDEKDKMIERAQGYAGKMAEIITARFFNEQKRIDDYFTRVVVTDGGEVTVSFTPMPELPAYNAGWREGMTPEEKKASISAIMARAEEMFQQAMASNGIVDPNGGGPAYTLDEYISRLSAVGAPQLHYYMNGSLVNQDPLRIMWQEMIQKQCEQAFQKAKSLLATLQERGKYLEEQYKTVARNGPNGDPRDLMVSGEYGNNGRLFSPFYIDSSLSPAEMNAYIEKVRGRYDAVIQSYTGYLENMERYFNDPELWKAYARYKDIYLFLPDSCLSLIPHHSDFSLLKVLDTGPYITASQYLYYGGYGYRSLIESRDLVIRDLENQRDKILAERQQDQPQQPPQTQLPPQSQENIRLIVNNREVRPDVPPQMINDRTMVPVRFVAQALDCQVDWDESGQTVIVTSPGYPKAVPPANSAGQIRILVNGNLIHPDVPPQMLNDRIMVPVRFIAEALGTDVKWDEQSQTITITGTVQPPAITPPQTQTPPQPDLHQHPEQPQPDMHQYQHPEQPSPSPETQPPAVPQTQTPPQPQSQPLTWTEWTVRTVGLNLPVEQDIKGQGDSPWTASGDAISYSSTGTQLYHNDFIITSQDFDVSDVTVTFEATGSFRTDSGYTGPTIAFAGPESIHNFTNTSGAIGVVGSYSWEQGKKDRGLLLFNYTGSQYFADRFIDYGDNTYRPYTMQIKNGMLTLTTPEGTTYTADVPGAKQGLRLPLVIAMREYDQGKTYSISIRNLKVIQ